MISREIIKAANAAIMSGNYRPALKLTTDEHICRYFNRCFREAGYPRTFQGIVQFRKKDGKYVKAVLKPR